MCCCHGWLINILLHYCQLTGRAVLGGKEIFERSGHFCDDRKPAGFDTKKVFLSPSMYYSGHPAYATPEA